MRIPSSAPQTPTSRHSDDFDQIIRNLNRHFNLGIVVVDITQSPLRRRAIIDQAGPTAKLSEGIRSHLHRHFWKDKLLLDEILARFRSEASDLYPGHGIPNDGQAEQLRELLLDILKEPPPETRSFQQAMAYSAVSTASRRSPKRSSDSDDSHSQSPRKAKNSHDHDIDDSPLPKLAWTKELSVRSADTTPAGSQSSHIPEDARQHRREAAPSANTSRSTLVPEVFSASEDEGDDLPGSQSTVEASPEERQRPVDDFPSSSPSPHHPGEDVVKGMVNEFSQSFREAQQNPRPVPDTPLLTPAQQALDDRLQSIWPPLPPCLNHAPLGVCWEFTRIALFCKVSMETLKDMKYSEAWLDQTELRKSLRLHPTFGGKTLPEKSSDEAWKASLSTFQEANSKVISLAVNLSWSTQNTGPLFDVSLQPLKLDQGHRLGRRFGADRFLDLNIPSPIDRKASPAAVRKIDGAPDVITRWVFNGKQFFAGRQWSAFYNRGWQKKERKSPSDDEVTLNFERVYCFAEDGNSFDKARGVPSEKEATQLGRRNKMKLSEMLDWAFPLSDPKNAAQPALKLYSRIALNLSKTWSAFDLEPDQIRHRATDIISPTGKVMNDGIARMSTGLARRIQEEMGLEDLPSAFQGRFGSAKGLWICDTKDRSDDIWIETYPSQRKWECDYVDVNHRTFEVKAFSRPPKPADVNMQFIVVLDAQAVDTLAMKRTLAAIMESWLDEKLRKQRSAMEDPREFSLWLHENYFQTYRPDRMKAGVDFLGGLPNKDAEKCHFLLAGGFHPMKLKLLNDLCWKLVEQDANRLQQTLKLRIPRSTYAFMAIDFEGILQPGEVHFGFSSNFKTDVGNETLLHGFDVLVARAPAHFPSDIQRVRAVFRPELAGFTDVIIFPSTGDVPLADLLSGGDYDGDQAWVCWDPNIVNNFRNAEPPEPVDFEQMGILRKEKGTLADLVASERGDMDAAVDRFLFNGCRFNMGEQLLGMCTKLKERLCYKNYSINDPKIVKLSSLLSALVDQGKQGIVFTHDDLIRFKAMFELILKSSDLPAYWQIKSTTTRNTSYSKPTDHVLDFLRFSVAEPKIEKAMAEFHEWRIADSKNYDMCLTRPVHELEAHKSLHLISIHKYLKKDLEQLFEKWRQRVGTWGTERFDEKVRSLYEAWRAIKPKADSRASDHGRLFFGAAEEADEDPYGRWTMFKASTTFREYYRNHETFTWTMAGRQLQRIKATAGGEVPESVTVVMPVYAVLRPDRGLVAGAAVARAGREDGTEVGEVDWDEETGTQLDDA
ncbi:RNA-dependent RNA polymerase [Plectosphaerella cucumerina]|uniref:RNA-dependent RNA polymerase n=1 Tax=Plectosphaerella cucumerina TaxID=40658 RepID=A0A8K0TGP9_9PEZI|nr:RNA-dependent RNA polymerase [Plectosphaerella cucumerina]